MIQLNHISKSYDNGISHVVKDLSLSIPSGELLVLLGSSGSGKTSTLKMINRLVEPSSGTITLDDKDIMQRDLVALRRSIGYVFQGGGLFSHLTVGENISIVLRLLRNSKAECIERARELLRLVNLEPKEYIERLPHELSGGQRQRIGVARALAIDPDYLLMDEPFGALDSITRGVLQDELLQLNRALHKTIIFVTHDITEAFRLADRIAILHQGRLQQVGTADELRQSPANDFVKALIQV